MIAYSTSSKEIQFWRRYKTFSVHSLPLEALNHSHPPSSPSCTPVTLTPSFWFARLYFMPRKSQSLLWSHGGIAQQWKNIATRKICLTVFKMPGRANSPYQSLCKGIRPGPQIPLFLISLGLFPNNLENVWLVLFETSLSSAKMRVWVFTKQGYLAWLAGFSTD